MGSDSKSKFFGIFLLFLSVASATVVQSFVLNADFFTDDFINFYEVSNVGFIEFLFTQLGGHLYVFFHLVLYLLNKSFGLEPLAYFSVVLIVHALNVVLLFAIIRNLTDNLAASTFGSALWGMNPLHPATLMWFAAFGNVIAATFLLLILLDISRIYSGKLEIGTALIVRWYLYVLCLASSFGLGIPLSTFLVLIVWSFLRGSRQLSRAVLVVLPLVVLVPIMFFGAKVVHHHFSLSPLASQLHSPFKGLLSVDNVAIALELSVGLIFYGITSLLLGPFFIYLPKMGPGGAGIRYGPLQGVPLSQLASLTLLIFTVFVVGAIIVWRRQRELRGAILGSCVIICLVYGPIVLTRVFLVASEVRTTIAVLTTGRYHYVPQLAFALLLSLFVHGFIPSRWFRSGGSYLRKMLLALVVFAAIIYPYYEFTSRFSAAGNKFIILGREQFQKVVSDIREEVVAQPKGSTVYLENLSLKSWITRPRFCSKEQFPGRLAVFVIAFSSDEIEGRKVRFVERDPTLQAFLKRKSDTRVSRLVVSPEEAARRLEGTKLGI